MHMVGWTKHESQRVIVQENGERWLSEHPQIHCLSLRLTLNHITVSLTSLSKIMFYQNYYFSNIWNIFGLLKAVHKILFSFFFFKVKYCQGWIVTKYQRMVIWLSSSNYIVQSCHHVAAYVQYWTGADEDSVPAQREESGGLLTSLAHQLLKVILLLSIRDGIDCTNCQKKFIKFPYV